jgi:hypothetical protein
MPGSKQDSQHTPAHAVGHRGRVLHQNGRGTPMKGRRIAPERLGRKLINLPPCLHGIHARH